MKPRKGKRRKTSPAVFSADAVSAFSASVDAWLAGRRSVSRAVKGSVKA